MKVEDLDYIELYINCSEPPNSLLFYLKNIIPDVALFKIKMKIVNKESVFKLVKFDNKYIEESAKLESILDYLESNEFDFYLKECIEGEIELLDPEVFRNEVKSSQETLEAVLNGQDD